MADRPIDESHPTRDQLRDFLLGQSADGLAAEIERHVNVCPICCDVLSVVNQEGDDFVAPLRSPGLSTPRAGEDTPADPSTSNDAMNVDNDSFADLAGTRIGPYKLLQPIGEGGMGIVYMCDQEHPVRRRVALKVIKPGMDSKQVIARFEAERQALAMMDHVNIAKVFDAGVTETGRPFFVMELVRGRPITEYCDQHKLTIRERLELFVPVCQAIQHAHQKGIIHRDIKPSNVLVCLYDGQPVPKIIDFGLAKALEQRLTERTMFTRYGQIVGTLEYMSPEQAELNQLDIDTRSDLYSLGVVLYELLTGSTALDARTVKESAFTDVLRMIREQEPPKPSTRLSRSGETLLAISTQRGTDPQKLGALVRGDLDWIVMKTLEKDRNRRYETANGLARDIQRYLHDEPIEARPPSTGYRLQKFTRKNRRLILTISAFALLLVMSSILSTYFGLQAMRRARDAVEARHAAEHQRQEAVTARDSAARERNRAQEARDNANRHLYHSLIREAQALRLARQPGSRAETWQRLRQAVALDSPNKDLEAIRFEAALSMGDFLGLEPVVVSDLPASITCAALDHEGTVLAVGLRDKTISLRNLATGIEITRLPLDEVVARPVRMQFFRRANALGVIHSDGRVHLWERAEAETWRLASNFEAGAPNAVVALSSDGVHVAVATENQIKVWHRESNRMIIQLDAVRKVNHLAVSPGAQWVAAGFYEENNERSGEGTPTVEVWEVSSGATTARLTPELHYIYSLGFSSDGRWLACACIEGVAVHQAPDFRRVDHLRGNMTYGVAFSPDGSWLAIPNAQEGVVRLRDLGSGQERVLLAHPGVPRGVAVSGNGRVVATVSEDSVRVWNLAGTAEKRNLMGHQGGVPGVVFSPDGRRLASISKDRTVRIWDPRSGAFQKTFTLAGIGQAIAFSPDGSLLATADYTAGTAQILDGTSGKELVAVREELANRVHSVAFSPDGRYFAAGAVPGLLVFDVDRETDQLSLRRLEKGPPVDRSVGHLCFSPGSQLLAWTTNDGVIRVWDLVSERELPSPGRVFARIHSLAFFPDGKRLIFLNQERMAEAWDVTIGQKLFSFPAPGTDEKSGNSYAMHISLSPDGHRLAASSISGRGVNVWDADRGKKIVSFPEEKGIVWSLAWSPDGEHLAVGRSDGGLAVWNWAEVQHQLAELGIAWNDEPSRQK